MTYRKVGKCYAAGGKHDMFPTRDDAKAWARERMHKHTNGRGKAFRCQFCEHYHVTRSVLGRGAVRARRVGKR